MAREWIQNSARPMCLLALFTVLGLTGSLPSALAQESLTVGDKVEVFFLNEWRPGVVVATDKNNNARVEFKFAASSQTQNFFKVAIRQPFENGALAPARTYSNKSGKFKVSAALIGVSNTEIALRKKDMSELKVPLDKLSDADQRYIQTLIKKGTIKLSDSLETSVGKTPTPPSSNEPANAKDMSLTNAGTRLADSMPGPRFSKSGDEFVAPISNWKPDPKLKVKLLEQDFWSLEPDTFTNPTFVSSIDLDKNVYVPVNTVLLSTADRTKMHVVTPFRLSKDRAIWNLLTGEQEAKSIEFPECEPIGLNSDGSQLLAYNELSNHKPGVSGDRLMVFKLEDSNKTRCDWMPYGLRRGMISACYIDDDHVMSVSELGDLGVWNLNKIRLVWWASIRPSCIPAVSPNGKQIFVQISDRLAVLDALTGKGVIPK